MRWTPKTVGRWLGGRVPHPRHRFRVAKHLRVEELFLWPAPAPTTPQQLAGSGPELIGTYQNRANVRRDTWLSLLNGAQEQISVPVFSEADGVRYVQPSDLDDYDIHSSMRQQIGDYLAGTYPYLG